MNSMIIKEIVNVYHIEQSDWERNFFSPREFDGIVLFTEGEIEYTFPDKTLVTKKGDMLFLPGNVPYSGKKHSEQVSFFVIDFRTLNKNDFENFGAPCVIKCDTYNNVLSEFSKALDIWEKQTTGTEFLLKSVLYFLLGTSYPREIKTNGTSPIGEILSYIGENLSDTELSVKKICENFFISESQLRRNFLKLAGTGPNEYISTLRINKAKSELSYTSKSISCISSECGFSSQYYFSRCFVKSTGMTPSKYRSLACI